MRKVINAALSLAVVVMVPVTVMQGRAYFAARSVPATRFVPPIPPNCIAAIVRNTATNETQVVPIQGACNAAAPTTNTTEETPRP